jgi:hypothetical protein
MKTKITTIILAFITLNISLWGNIPPQNAPTMLPPAGTPVLKEKLNFPDIDLDLSKYVDLKEGLIAHYPFSGNSEDQSGNKNHLENNEATLTLDRFGMKDSAYAFDGKASHLFAEIEDRKGDFSLSLWAKANDVEQSRYRSVINIHDKTPGSKDTCQIHTSGGRYPTYQFFSSNPESFALVTQKWQNLAVSVSGKVIRFYENGEKVYSQELEGGEANQFSNIIIGKNRHGAAKFHGSIDDVYVYDRAINDAEVARLFDGGFEDSDGDGLTDEYEVGFRPGPNGNESLRYKVINDKKYTFREAEKKAIELGGHLATIISSSEDAAIQKALNGILTNTVWIGGTDEKTEGIWEWVTGELWKFSNWDNGQPESSKYQGTEDFSKRYASGVWHDWRNSQRNEYFLLEYGFYTDPTLADSDGDGVNDGKEVAANTDPNNPYSRPAPKRNAPSEGPGTPPAPDYKDTITELSEKVRVHEISINELEEQKQAHIQIIEDLNLSNSKLSKQADILEESVASLTGENASLRSSLKNTREDKSNLEYQVNVVSEQLSEAVRIAQTPFTKGWIYDPEQGWLFTSADHYPLIYSESTKSWHYYELGSSEPRYFFSYAKEKWEAWDIAPSGDSSQIVKNDNL